MIIAIFSLIFNGKSIPQWSFQMSTFSSQFFSTCQIFSITWSLTMPFQIFKMASLIFISKIFMFKWQKSRFSICGIAGFWRYTRFCIYEVFSETISLKTCVRKEGYLTSVYRAKPSHTTCNKTCVWVICVFMSTLDDPVSMT